MFKKLCEYYWFRRVCDFLLYGISLNNYPVNKKYDVWMWESLKHHDVIPNQYSGIEYRVVLNGTEIWVNNWPYAYGQLGPISVDLNYNYLPTRITKNALKAAVQKHSTNSKDTAKKKLDLIVSQLNDPKGSDNEC